MNKRLLIIIGVLFLVGFVIAQGNLIPPGLMEVTGPYPLVSCSETDNGPDIYTRGFYPITYFENGSLQNATGNDFCLNNNDLLEGVCGSWINTNFNTTYNTSGFLATFNCSASNNGNQEYGCGGGACRQYYDTFSSGSLNISNWLESTFQGLPFTDEHFVNSTEGAYHIIQNNQIDTATNIQPIGQFVAGQTFYYEVNYLGGLGNHASQPLINGNYPPTQMEPCNYQTAGCGVIGYWNAAPDLGAQIGTYRITFEFFPSQVKMTAVRPDGVTVVNTFTGNSQPYTLTINTHTGHNGLMHFDYDNAMVY